MCGNSLPPEEVVDGLPDVAEVDDVVELVGHGCGWPPCYKACDARLANSGQSTREEPDRIYPKETISRKLKRLVMNLFNLST